MLSPYKMYTRGELYRYSMIPRSLGRQHDEMDDNEKSRMLPGAWEPVHSRTKWTGHVPEWISCLALIALGSWADRQMPFKRELKPQLTDPSIAYHHTPAELQQVPTWLLWRISLWLPIAIVTILALFFPPRAYSAARLRLASELWLGVLSSFALTFFVICQVKVSVGRLRPDFLARCIPRDGECTGDPKIITEGRKSFPSGHSALSFASLGFVSLVLAARLAHTNCCGGRLWKLCVAAIPWLIALHVALSRLSDYWHHWDDVLTGSLLGNLAAALTYTLRFLSPLDGLWIRELGRTDLSALSHPSQNAV